MREHDDYLRMRRRRRRSASALQDAEREDKPAPQPPLVTQGDRSPDASRRTLSPDDLIPATRRGTGDPWRRL